ncbi:MAG TPA: O-antigen ligase family protein [Candidatus Dormibacteraeota bacterium]|nr:O-antigen ligase family protein [Candidatus Dormibacteraeota bacterium]
MRETRNPENRRREVAAQVETALLYGIFGLLLFGPLAFGAVEPWSIFLMEAGSAALFLLWIGKQVLDGDMKIRWNPLFLPMGIFALLIVSQLVFRITAYRHDTVSLALLYLSYAMLCFLAGQTLIRGSQARTLALIFSLYGAALASFALLQGISSNGRLYWIRQPRMGGWIYGPYVNHNHYAGLMEMLVPIPLVLALTRLAPSRTRAVAGAVAAVMVGTIFLSGSRGGMLAILAELIILSALLVKQKRSLRTAIGVGVFLAIVVGLLTWVGGAELSKRIATVGPSHIEISGDVRAYINRDGFKMFLKKPVLGWGLGTFPVVYPQFRTFYTNFFVNEAHNDYLQLLVEMGLLGFATMIWFLVTLYTRALKKIGNWTGEISGAVTLACVLGFTGILVHSVVDFNLQIPANAALFYVLCTVAAAEPFAQPARKRRVARSKPPEELPASPEALHQPATNF